MHVSRTLRVLVATATLAVVVGACSSSSDKTSSTTDKTNQTSSTTTKNGSDTIVGVASANPDFSTLVTAVTKAGLVETLNGAGPYTVFAPTNAAFAKIPADQLGAILADTAQLKKILTYHVVPGKVMAADLQPEQMVKTVEGQDVDIKVANSTATINGCNIVTTDVAASNGVIHVIDCVLIPPA